MATPTKQSVVKVKKTVSKEKVEPKVEPVVEKVEEQKDKDIIIVIKTDEEKETMKERFEKMIKSKQEYILEVKKEIQELRKLQKDHEQAVKEASKRKKKVPSGEKVPRKPSGFASPVVVSDSLYKFLAQYGVKKGDLVARTDVTRYISTYIKEKDLQNPEHRREIVPDNVLQKLLGPAIEQREGAKEGEPKVYTYLKLQKYLSAHFPKKAAAPSESSE